MDTKVTFKPNMFVYAAERYDSSYMQSSIKVIIPEAFFVDINNNPLKTMSQKGNTSIFVNANIPALSQYSTKFNYIDLPITQSTQLYTIVYNENRIITNYIIEKGTRFMAQFINSNPKYGLIIARC